MPIAVVLAVGLDSLHLASQKSLWKSAGYVVVPARSIKDAIDHFHAGDFDLVLLGHTLSTENKERLTFLIRKSGSRTPVISIRSSPGDCDSFADATLRNEPNEILAGMAELLAKHARFSFPPKTSYRRAS
jgi:DNA-binding NtrC family response regulator